MVNVGDSVYCMAVTQERIDSLDRNVDVLISSVRSGVNNTFDIKYTRIREPSYLTDSLGLPKEGKITYCDKKYDVVHMASEKVSNDRLYIKLLVPPEVANIGIGKDKISSYCDLEVNGYAVECTRNENECIMIFLCNTWNRLNI